MDGFCCEVIVRPVCLELVRHLRRCEWFWLQLGEQMVSDQMIN